MKKIKILISGSRNLKQLPQCLGEVLKDYSDKNDIVIIHGGAIGIDTCADEWSKENKVETIVIKPNYSTNGKRAPLIRNKEMVDIADIIICVSEKQSGGTWYTFQYATKQRKRTIWWDEKVCLEERVKHA